MTENTNCDWYTKPGKVEKGPEFPVLDPAKRYTLTLADISFKAAVTRTFKGESRTVDEVTTVWQVEGTQAKVWQRFTYSWNVKANMVIFIKQMGYYLEVGTNHALAAFFSLDPPTQITCRLVPREKDGQPTGYYSIDITTVRLIGDVPADVAPQNQVQDPVEESNPELERIYEFLQKGQFKNKEEALRIGIEYAGIKDSTLFAVAWTRYAQQHTAPQKPITVAS